MTGIPPQITFHGLQPSEELERDVRDRVAWLEQFYTGVLGCRVRLEVPHRHHSHGRHMHVHIELTVPGGGPIVIAHEPSLQPTLKDVNEPEAHKDSEIAAVHRYARVAIHEAFDVARRRLQDFAREQRGDVKTHGQPA